MGESRIDSDLFREDKARTERRVERERPAQEWRYCPLHDIEFKTRSPESLKHGACKPGPRAVTADYETPIASAAEPQENQW